DGVVDEEVEDRVRAAYLDGVRLTWRAHGVEHLPRAQHDDVEVLLPAADDLREAARALAGADAEGVRRHHELRRRMRAHIDAEAAAGILRRRRDARRAVRDAV